MRVRTTELIEGLRHSYDAEAGDAAKANRKLSGKEAKTIKSEDLVDTLESLDRSGVAHPFPVEAITDRAVLRARAGLRAVQPKKAEYVSAAHLKKLEKKNPALGARAREVWSTLKGGAGSPDNATALLWNALAPYLGDPAPISIGVDSAKAIAGGLEVKFSAQRGDGTMISARAKFKGEEMRELDLISVPAQLPTALVAKTKAALGAKATLAAALEGPSGVLVAYDKTAASGAIEHKLGVVSAGKLKSLKPTADNLDDLRDLAADLIRGRAIWLATEQDQATAANRAAGEVIPGPVGPAARLEVELRLATVSGASLEEVAPGDSPVGFDPATDALQLVRYSVLGDNAIFVTFAKDGTFRVDDFN